METHHDAGAAELPWWQTATTREEIAARSYAGLGLDVPMVGAMIANREVDEAGWERRLRERDERCVALTEQSAARNRREHERWKERRRQAREEFPALSAHLGMRLLDGGITRRNIAAAPDASLLAVRAVGPATVRRIRSAYPAAAPSHSMEAVSLLWL
jgi:hypothetical protein